MGFAGLAERLARVGLGRRERDAVGRHRMTGDEQAEAGRTVVGVPAGMRVTGTAVVVVRLGTVGSDVVMLVMPRRRAEIGGGVVADQAVKVEAREKAVRQKGQDGQNRAGLPECPTLPPRLPERHPRRPTDMPEHYNAVGRGGREPPMRPRSRPACSGPLTPAAVGRARFPDSQRTADPERMLAPAPPSQSSSEAPGVLPGAR